MASFEEVPDDSWSRLDGVSATAEVLRNLHPRAKAAADQRRAAAAKPATSPVRRGPAKAPVKQPAKRGAGVTLRVSRNAPAYEPAPLRPRGVPDVSLDDEDSDDDDDVEPIDDEEEEEEEEDYKRPRMVPLSDLRR